MADRYIRAPWGPGEVLKYIDTGLSYNGAPVYVVATDVQTPNTGLESEHESITYEVAEIERHLHGRERWFGAGGQTLAPFVLDSGNNTWGAWVTLLTAGNTPAIPNMKYYDAHRILVMATERNTVYRVQFAWGASGAAGLAANNYTEFPFIAASASIDSGPVVIQMPRLPAGTPLYGRCWNAADTGTLSLLVGIHEYEG